MLGVTWMKITRIKIYGFGRWLNQEFKLNDDLQIFVGLNEAGKSTLVAFIVGMLFGFSNKRGHHQNTYEPLNGGVYGGELNLVIKGVNYLLTRKNRTSTVTSLYNTDLGIEIKNANEHLAQLLAPLTKESFQQIYGFSQLDLNEIIELDEQELKKRLQEIGAVGARDWRQLANTFDKKAQGMFAANSKTGKRPLNEKMKQYRRLVKELQVAKQNFPEYRQLLQEQQINEQKLGELEQAIKTQNTLQQELTNLQPLLGLYKEQQLLINSIDKSVAPKIADDLQQRVTELTFQRDNLIEEINRLKQEPPTANDDELLVFFKKHEQTLQRLEHELPNYQQMITEQKILEQQVQSLKQQLNKQQAVDVEQRPIEQQGKLSLPLLFLFLGLVISIVFIPIPWLSKGIGLVIILGCGGWYGLHIKHNLQRQSTKQKLDNTVLGQQPLAQKIVALESEIGSIQLKISNVDQILTHLNLSKFTFIKQADWHENIVQLYEFFNLIHAKQAQWVTMEAAINYQQKHLQELEQQLENIVAQIKAIYLGLQVDDDEDYYWQLSQQTIYAEQQAKLKVLNQQLATSNSLLLEQYTDAHQLTGAIEESKAKINELNQKIKTIQDQITNLRVTLKSLANDASVEKLTQAVANSQADILQNLENYLANSLAAQWIDQTLLATSADRLPQIIKQAKLFFTELTLKRYTDIKLEANELQLITKNNELLKIEQLSKGTSEQLYVALRLAFVVVLNDVVKMPIIIDDAFVNFDDQRKQESYQLLKEISRNNQVIYVTADSRIKDVVDQRKITAL